MRVAHLSLIVASLLLVDHVQSGHHHHPRRRRAPPARRDAGARRRARFVGGRPAAECPGDAVCRLRVADLAAARRAFLDAVDHHARLVHFTIDLADRRRPPVLESYPYMEPSYGATEWVWVSGGGDGGGGGGGRSLLSLPLDADVLSVYALGRHGARIRLHAVRHEMLVQRALDSQQESA